MRLEKELKIQQSNLSKHLERLANAGIIVSRRESQFIYYTVNVDIL
ncbi:MAG: helix-turn-helix transcriptional regulator [Thermotogae bacterium]|nr:helix-turn-helix transcriptional regulator [Thermotogota bacterium]